jgi:hypothetical protein
MYEEMAEIYNEIVDIDLSVDALFFKTYQAGKINSIVKLNKVEIKEIKLKKSTILFYTLNPVISNNPLNPECIFNVYLQGNYNIELIYQSEDKEELIKFEEYIKSILI